MNLTADQVLAICAVMTVVGGIIAWVLNVKDKAQEAQIAAHETSLKAAWKKIDELRDERALLWTRAEQERFEGKIEMTTKDLRSEIRADLESLGTRLSSDLANLGNRLDNTVREMVKTASGEKK